jgi:hypothetical protein
LTEPPNGGWTCGAKRSPHSIPLRIGQLAFQTLASFSEEKVTFTLVLLADPALYQTVIDQSTQHTIKGLFCNTKNRQEIIDSRAVASIDKVDRTVMRPSVAFFFEDAIRVCRETAVGKIHCLDPLP